jgi:hypothetical protein
MQQLQHHRTQIGIPSVSTNESSWGSKQKIKADSEFAVDGM